MGSRMPLVMCLNQARSCLVLPTHLGSNCPLLPTANTLLVPRSKPLTSFSAQGNVQLDILMKVLPWPVWLYWLENCPIDQKVVSSIHSQGTYLGCRFDPQSRHVREGNQLMFLSHINVLGFFSSLSLPSFLSKKQ